MAFHAGIMAPSILLPSPEAYAPHEDLVAPARRQPALWRLLIGLVLVAAMLIIGANLLFVVALWNGADPHTLSAGQTPGSMLAVLGGFAFVSLGVIFAARLMQWRSAVSLLGPMPRVLYQFRRTLVFMALLLVVLMVLPPFGMGIPLEPNLPLGQWLHYLPLALICVLIQVEAEELLFRGYLQQTLAARFNARWVWMGLPSALFAYGHYLPQEAGDNAVLIAVWAGIFGLLMADLTARAGSLGPAIAVHFANNIVALLIVGSPSSLGGLALYLLPYEMSDAEQLRPWLMVDFAVMLVSWLTARLAIRA